MLPTPLPNALRSTQQPHRRDESRLQAALSNLRALAASQPQHPQVSGLVCDVSVAADVDRLQQHVADAFSTGFVHRCAVRLLCETHLAVRPGG